MLLPVNQSIIEWACEMHDTPALVLDTETTGGAKYDEVIDLGIVVSGSGKVLFDEIFRPEVPVNEHAFKVHGITDSRLVQANKFHTYAEQLYEILESAPLIVWNSNFDERMMIQTFQKYGMPVPQMKFVCAMQKYKHYSWSPKVTSLTNACYAMRVQAGSHRAITDALACARVIFRVTRGYTPSNEFNI